MIASELVDQLASFLRAADSDDLGFDVADEVRAAALGALIEDALEILYGPLGDYDGGPWLALGVLAGLSEEVESITAKHVREVRAAGCPWSQIGDALGVSRQAAQQRFGGAK